MKVTVGKPGKVGGEVDIKMLPSRPFAVQLRLSCFSAAMVLPTFGAAYLLAAAVGCAAAPSPLHGRSANTSQVSIADLCFTLQN